MSELTAVFTTLAGMILAYVEASRYDFIVSSYRVTARRLRDLANNPPANSNITKTSSDTSRQEQKLRVNVGMKTTNQQITRHSRINHPSQDFQLVVELRSQLPEMNRTCEYYQSAPEALAKFHTV